MSFRPNVLQALRNRARVLGRLLLPALTVALLCPVGVVCADISAAANGADLTRSTGHAGHAERSGHADHGAPSHEHGTPSSGDSDDGCPHCPTHGSAVTAARDTCDFATEDAPPSVKLHHDLTLTALATANPAAPAIPHPSPPRTAYSTGAAPPAVPLNLLHCVFLI